MDEHPLCDVRGIIQAAASFLGSSRLVSSGASSDLLARFAHLVFAWNTRVNLVGCTSLRELVEILFADALMLAEGDLVPRGRHVLDVGSGCGAPVLPLLLLRGDLRATLLEPRRKRVMFLRTAVGELGVAERARILEVKLMPATPLDGSPFDIAMSRATFKPSEWLDLGSEFSRALLAFTSEGKGLTVPDHIELVREVEYALPFSHAKRTIGLYICR